MYLVKAENLTLTRNKRNILENINWEIRPGENWAVTGPNGCGKTILMQVIQGKLPYSSGMLHYQHENLHSEISGISFEMQQKMMEYEYIQSFSRDFACIGDNERPTVLRILKETAESGESSYTLDGLVEATGIESILDSIPAELSNGETRKFLVTRELLKPHRILVLDEPYDGLDADSRSKMTDFFSRLSTLDTSIILVTHHTDEISESISHILYLEDGKVVFSGPREKVLERLETRNPESTKREHAPEQLKSMIPCRHEVSAEPVIEMKNINVSYGSKKIITGLDWTVRRNENWVISGPNGAGKSTLLKLISGDLLQAYSNDIRLFGRKRGTGESIWDIKARQGFLSPEYQNNYRHDINSLDVVISGFFDSTGLYRKPDEKQKKTAIEWLEYLDLSGIAEKNFRLLSYGERRMVLVARALVKSPEMLILDEPCQGLDSLNRQRLVSTLSETARSTGIQILYVSHRKDEFPDCMTHILEFIKNENHGYRHIQEKLNQKNTP
jgi:molybdate transport system ATP-binding protein